MKKKRKKLRKKFWYQGRFIHKRSSYYNIFRNENRNGDRYSSLIKEQYFQKNDMQLSYGIFISTLSTLHDNLGLEFVKSRWHNLHVTSV